MHGGDEPDRSAAAAAGAPAARGAAPGSRPGRFRALGGVLLFLLVVLALEALARLIPLQRWDPRFAGPRSYPVFVRGEGANAGRYVTNEHYRGELNFQSFSLEKPAGTFRVFVLGGSAAYGWPAGATYGFTGILRRALEQAAPGRFEIVNAAGMSYGSLRVLDFLREIVAAYRPDLVVVYSGSNEYIERNALPANEPDFPGLMRVRNLLRSSALYRALRLLLVRAAPAHFVGTGGGDPPALRSKPVQRGHLGRSPQIDREVLAAYRRNLREMARTLERAGVPGLFCTVPVNLADWPPSAVTGAGRGGQQLAEGRAALERGDVATALERLAAARALAPEDAEFWYWTGKALLRAGDPDAAEALSRARDADPRVQRALSSFNREVNALSAAHAGVSVLDLAQGLAAASPGGVPGQDLFLDYVHLNQQGHRLVALALLPALAEGAPGTIPLAAAAWLVRNDPGYGEDALARAREAYARGLGHQQNERWADAERDFEEVLGSTVDYRAEALVNLAESVDAQGDRRRAELLYEQAAAAATGNGPVLQQLAKHFQDSGRPDRAEALYREALRLSPLYPLSHQGIGEILLARSEAREAAGHFASASALGLDTAELARAWGAASLALGDTAEAIAHWERAVELDPLDEDSRRQLAALKGGSRPPLSAPPSR